MEKWDKKDIGLEREGRGQVGASLGRWAGLEVALSTGQTGVGSRGALSLPALRLCNPSEAPCAPETLQMFGGREWLRGGSPGQQPELTNIYPGPPLSPFLPLPVSPLSLFQLQIQFNSSSSELP